MHITQDRRETLSFHPIRGDPFLIMVIVILGSASQQLVAGLQTP